MRARRGPACAVGECRGPGSAGARRPQQQIVRAASGRAAQAQPAVAGEARRFALVQALRRQFSGGVQPDAFGWLFAHFQNSARRQPALRAEAIQLTPPGPGELRVLLRYSGVNYVDIYHRQGLYPLPALPATLPDEAVAAALLRGITAHMLFAWVWRPQAGETVLVHAAAGGLGLVLIQ